MKHLLSAALIACSLIASPIAAQQEDDTGSNLMERGAKLFWEGLRDEMAPSLQELEGLMAKIGPSMQGFLAEMGPALAKIADQVEDWSRYEAPEILPSGDIIIRRKPEVEDQPKTAETPESREDGATDI